jgi:archaellum component FlaC
MDRLEDRQEKLTNSVNGLKIHIENETDKNIQILIEQYNPNVERLDDSVKRVEKLEFDVDSIKKVVISHSHEINKLMSRK